MPSGQPDAIADAAVLDQFLVLPENRFAHSVLLAWDLPPTTEPLPPVFLYGPSGTGKSHLIQAALRHLSETHPGWTTLALTAADFAAGYAEAAETRGFRVFRKQFQRLNVLAIEDLHALSGKFEPQRQLVAMLDDVVAHDCRLIVSCRTSAAEVSGLIPELVNRCHGAISVPLRLPALNSRERLLNHWIKISGLSIAPEVAPFLAEKFVVSPRELHGVLIQLRAISQQRKLTLSVDLVRRHLLGQHPNRVFPVPDIAKSVARHFQVTLAELRAKSRQPRLVLPRQCAIFLIRELTDLSLQKIGEYFGGRDHSTILHSCHKLISLLPEQPDLRQHLAKIRTQLQAPQ
ncbi:MAG: DnaA/Hda family protein [Planctomycetota bacterium]